MAFLPRFGKSHMMVSWNRSVPVMVARKYCPVVVCVVEFRTMLYAGFRLTAKDFMPPSAYEAAAFAISIAWIDLSVH